jgi:hypothetical protein
MVIQVESSLIKRQFEDLRIKNRFDEAFLLESIQKEGILQPLGCIVQENSEPVLLDGFKRLRSAIQLRIATVPVLRLGEDEVQGCFELLYQSSDKTLNILEQAAFCDHLHTRHKLGVFKIAQRLKKSPAWVSVRLGILSDMSEGVKGALFDGRFPMRSYMYSLKPFTRVNKTPKKDLDEFVQCVAGKGLSTRDIERLALGFFKGGEPIKDQIRNGDIPWTLKQLKSSGGQSAGAELNEVERRFMRDLEMLDQSINRLILAAADNRLKDAAFLKKICMMTGKILEKIAPLKSALGGFHDYRGE